LFGVLVGDGRLDREPPENGGLALAQFGQRAADVLLAVDPAAFDLHLADHELHDGKPDRLPHLLRRQRDAVQAVAGSAEGGFEGGGGLLQRFQGGVGPHERSQHALRLGLADRVLAFELEAADREHRGRGRLRHGRHGPDGGGHRRPLRLGGAGRGRQQRHQRMRRARQGSGSSHGSSRSRSCGRSLWHREQLSPADAGYLHTLLLRMPDSPSTA
jgi:hypothetical protein